MLDAAERRRCLEDKTKEELVVIARELEISGARKTTKAALILEILATEQSQRSTSPEGENGDTTTIESAETDQAVDPGWWQPYHNHVYGAATIAGLLIAVVTIYPKQHENVDRESELRPKLKPPYSQFEIANAIPVSKICDDRELLESELGRKLKLVLDNTLQRDERKLRFPDLSKPSNNLYHLLRYDKKTRRLVFPDPPKHCTWNISGMSGQAPAKALAQDPNSTWSIDATDDNSVIVPHELDDLVNVTLQNENDSTYGFTGTDGTVICPIVLQPVELSRLDDVPSGPATPYTGE